MMQDVSKWGDLKELEKKLYFIRNLEGELKNHCAEMYNRPGHQHRCDLINSLLKTFVTQRDFLDVGCAEGIYCKTAKQFGAHRVVGTDLAASKIKHASSRYPDCEFYCKSIFELDEFKNQFDIVICLEVLQHVIEYKLAACSVLDCLKTGGIAIFTVPNLSTTTDHVLANISSDMSVDQLVEEISIAGAGNQNALWKYNSDKLYDEILMEYPRAKLVKKIPVDTPDGQRINLWTIGIMKVI